jgi:hypothetical protein
LRVKTERKMRGIDSPSHLELGRRVVADPWGQRCHWWRWWRKRDREVAGEVRINAKNGTEIGGGVLPQPLCVEGVTAVYRDEHEKHRSSQRQHR